MDAATPGRFRLGWLQWWWLGVPDGTPIKRGEKPRRAGKNIYKNDINMGVETKIGGCKTPKMDGEH